MGTYVVGFDAYAQAREAVDALVAAGFPRDRINAIVQEESAAHGHARATGLDAIVAGKESVVTEDAGKIVPAGEVARNLAGAATGQARGHATLEASLAESGVPETLAHNHSARLAAGGVVLVLIVRDDRSRRALMALDPHGPRDGAGTRRRGASRPGAAKRGQARAGGR